MLYGRFERTVGVTRWHSPDSPAQRYSAPVRPVPQAIPQPIVVESPSQLRAFRWEVIIDAVKRIPAQPAISEAFALSRLA